MPAKPFVTRPADHVPLHVVGETISVIANGTQTGSIEVFLQTCPEGAGPPPHSHEWDEAYYMLEGRLEVTADAETRTMIPGEFIHIPHGVLHSFRAAAGGAKFVSINSKAGAAAMFMDIDRETKGAMDIPKILAVAARHNLHVPLPSAVQ